MSDQASSESSSAEVSSQDSDSGRLEATSNGSVLWRFDGMTAVRGSFAAGAEGASESGSL